MGRCWHAKLMIAAAATHVIAFFLLVKLMRINRNWLFRLANLRCWGIVVVATWLLVGNSLNLRADTDLDQQFPAPTGTDDEQQLEKWTSRLQRIQAGLNEAGRQVPGVLDLQDDGVACWLESPYFAQYYSNRQQHRFLVGRLIVLNQTDRELSCPIDQLQLQFAGLNVKMDPQPENQRYASLHFNNRNYSLREFKPAEKLVIPAGQISSSWVVFNGLDPGTDVPSLSLLGTVGQQPFELDLRLQNEAILGWSRQQIGPQNVLAVGTIAGELNTINLGTMIDDMALLSTQNVTRFVVQFADQAEPVDSHLLQWLYEISRKAGVEQTRTTRTELPVVPSIIRELHLCKIPGEKSTSSRRTGPVRVHETLPQAVIAATSSAYETISLKSLLNEIERGHPLSRCAALTHGAIRLPPSVLPQVLQLARADIDESSDYAADLRQAAIFALSEFPQPEATKTLVELARSPVSEVAGQANAQPEAITDEQADEQADEETDEETSDDAPLTVSEAALSSLATSRFPAHQAALMSLLDSPAEFQQQVVRAMAQYPQQQWSEILFEYASGGPKLIRKEAIVALNVVGHPRLPQLLSEILQGSDADLRTLALGLFAQRNDPESRQLVTQFALTALKTDPTTEALQVVTNYKIHSAIPRLLELLEEQPDLRSPIIKALAVIGDERIVEALLELYPQLKPAEQIGVLQTVASIHPDRFLLFVPQAVPSAEDSVVSVIAGLLRQVATAQAVEVLITSLKQDDLSDNAARYLMQALGNLSTPESRRYLISVRDSDDERLKELARASLTTLYSRSPVNFINQQALQTLKSGNPELAVKQFGLAIDGDPEYPLAYQGRAEAYRLQSRYEPAIEDYQTLLALDPNWPGAAGGLGQALTSLARFEQALPYLDRAIELDSDNSQWYSARAHANSMLERFEPAERDYRKALELNPQNMTALTGVALSLAISGEIDEAIALLEKGKDEFGDNPVFAYNTACTYARAAESLQKQPDPPTEQIIKLVKIALDELERSIPLGYEDATWTKNDPDLKILREQARFSAALEKMESVSKTQQEPDAKDDEPPKP